MRYWTEELEGKEYIEEQKIVIVEEQKPEKKKTKI